MAENFLYLLNPSTKEKIILSMCLQGYWFVPLNVEEKYEKFIGSQRNDLSIKDCILYYEKPFYKTPSIYQKTYLLRKFYKNRLLSNANGSFSVKNIENEEIQMNFQEATEAAKSGARLTRPSWEDNMYMWWGGSFLIHTHPYFEFQTKSPTLSGYFYVVEKDDATCDDWKIVNA